MVKKVLKRLGIGLGLVLLAAIVFVPVGWLLGDQIDHAYARIVFPRVAREIESRAPVDVLCVKLHTYLVVALEGSQIKDAEAAEQAFDAISLALKGKTLGTEYVMVLICRLVGEQYITEVAILYPSEAMGQVPLAEHMATFMPMYSPTEEEFIMWPGRN